MYTLYIMFLIYYIYLKSQPFFKNFLIFFIFFLKVSVTLILIALLDKRKMWKYAGFPLSGGLQRKNTKINNEKIK